MGMVTVRVATLMPVLVELLVRALVVTQIHTRPMPSRSTLIIYQLMLGPCAAHDNLGTALTWVLWWPLIPIIFLFLGRFWCAICPFATINDLVQKFVGNNRPVPRFLKKYGIWIIDALFIFITWSDHVWGVVENPFGSGVLMLMLTTGVIASGS